MLSVLVLLVLQVPSEKVRATKRAKAAGKEAASTKAVNLTAKAQ
jgi:hypothetical protein